MTKSYFDVYEEGSWATGDWTFTDENGDAQATYETVCNELKVIGGPDVFARDDTVSFTYNYLFDHNKLLFRAWFHMYGNNWANNYFTVNVDGNAYTYGPYNSNNGYTFGCHNGGTL